MKEIFIDNTSYCYVCGAEIETEGNSFHAWNVKYTCGCEIGGAISDVGTYVFEKCPKEL